MRKYSLVAENAYLLLLKYLITPLILKLESFLN